MQYNNAFFLNRKKITQESAKVIFDILFNTYKPKSMLDIGCATGIWLAEAKKLGVQNVMGVDGPWVPRDQLVIDDNEFQEKNIEDIPSFPSKEYDLALCIEVAEHLSEHSGQKLIESITCASDLVLFSAAVPGQGGTGHINENHQSYWHKEFSKHNYECFDLIRPSTWDNNHVNVIYKQNMLLYALKNSPAYNALVQNHPVLTKSFELDRVHPELLWLRTRPKPPKTFAQKVKAYIKRVTGCSK